MNALLASRWTKAAAFLLCLTPLLLLIWRFRQQELGANPLEFLTHATGDWTLWFLLFTLCITPLRRLTNRQVLLRYRRMLGLFAFFYACLHFTTYLVFDKFFDTAAIWGDIAKRPYITVGFAGFVGLIPLAITSTKGWIRRLGGKRWQWLHRLVYASALAGVVHYFWLVKSDIRKPLLDAAILAVLLGFRLIPARAFARIHATR